ncbi:MAG: glycoside hydrolase family 18 protein [Verrucomicrobia bacterium]|nr:glycoside hydrolase family 18 protein [Verrucomicrobiota bacterium]
MNWHWRAYCSCLLGCLFFLSTFHARADLWNTGYYPGYRQNTMPASVVDFSALTHVIHFALIPNSDGTLNSSLNVVSAPNSSDLISKAHAAGKPVLISVGGAGSSFPAATSSQNVGKFTTNIVNFMVSRGYDGVDIDWEPILASETNQFATFITMLRAQLDTIAPRPLLTTAVAWQPQVFATLQDKFDQINIMTYDMSGTWPGWVTWHNAPLFDGGYNFPSTGKPVPSTETMVNNFINAGVQPEKLGIGIAFYGKVWSGGAGTTNGGATDPRQSWSTAPIVTSASFNAIMTTYYQTNRYHWDTNAQAAYLSIDNAGSADDKFISYDDERSCQTKVSYARNRRLGGVMIWELGQGYRSGEPAGKREPLLQAIKAALATPGIVSIERTNQNVQLSFSSLHLGQYSVLWSTNPGSENWNTLTTNLIGTGANLLVIDTNAVSQPHRFYRIQTPP